MQIESDGVAQHILLLFYVKPFNPIAKWVSNHAALIMSATGVWQPEPEVFVWCAPMTGS